tara:strand:+ start:613 stop:1764 length:1152 start_codon:yes stop_codon:yes gene_type:complete
MRKYNQSIHHVCSFIFKKQLSGHSYSVPALCESISKIRDTHLHVTKPNNLLFNPSFTLHEYDINTNLKPILSSKDFKLGLNSIVKDGDIIHNHGLWRMPNIYTLLTRINKDVKLVISPRGSLSIEALKISKTKKFIFSNLFRQKELLNRCDAFHATSIKEKDEIRNLGLKQPIAIIPNGIDLPISLERKFNRNKIKFLFLGRIHPIKGLDLLIDAWSNFAENNIELEICGYYEDINYFKSLKRKVELKKIENINFSGPVSKKEKSKKFLENDIFILPSKSENFGLVVAEALAHGMPVIASDKTQWESLIDEKCGWVTSLNREDLINNINMAFKTPLSTLSEMGLNGRALIKNRYSWTNLSNKYNQFYNWLSSGSNKPEFVDLF